MTLFNKVWLQQYKMVYNFFCSVALSKGFKPTLRGFCDCLGISMANAKNGRKANGRAPRIWKPFTTNWDSHTAGSSPARVILLRTEARCRRRQGDCRAEPQPSSGAPGGSGKGKNRLGSGNCGMPTAESPTRHPLAPGRSRRGAASRRPFGQNRHRARIIPFKKQA